MYVIQFWNFCNLDKHDQNYGRGCYYTSKPRRESASRVDEFSRTLKVSFPIQDKALPPQKSDQSLMNQNITVSVGDAHHFNTPHFSNINNSCVKKPSQPWSSINQNEDIVLSSIMQLVEMGESPDLPGFFESVTPPHNSPVACIKTEKVQPDACAFAPSSPGFASLLDVSLPEQVIVKREPNLENNGMQTPQQHFPASMLVPQQVPHNTFMTPSYAKHLMPLTPPSEPGSDSVDSLTIRTTPPPPYASTIGNGFADIDGH
ncbi:dendritic arbor reduction protein 1 [Caerostris extrusa]|uniref:Dendritic arbor reduction protein 1 n=1 Tax=Caerostris extrusa TaxID=172846 RepID=A0AAV4SW99_CAEEX|nr:dendritic arbor reduction protein 1 [Caerostris extrusa]